MHPPNVLNVILTMPRAGSSAPLPNGGRTTANSSCGLCGRTSIESLASDAAPLTSTMTVKAMTLSTLPDQLRSAQTVFDDTGGLHAAGLFDGDGRLVGSAEDVGRHNAVDKVVGRMAPGRRASAWPDDSVRERPHVVRNRPESALRGHPHRRVRVGAIEPGHSTWRQTCGITLVGFVRGEGFNIYTHAERIHS